MNAYRRWLTGCAIAAVSTAACGKARELVERDDDEVADNDYFYLQRVSRDGRIDPQARSRALFHARLLKARAALAPSSLAAVGAWQQRGPLNVGGRVADLVGDPVDAGKFYVGAASGGVWKTVDGGATWQHLGLDKTI